MGDVPQDIRRQDDKAYSDKVRGAIFNMIGPYFEGGASWTCMQVVVVYLIEAVSRGMSSAVLVERDRKAQAIVAEISR